MELHQNGHFEAAARGYRALLGDISTAADAHHNLAVLLAETDELPSALAHGRAALRCNPAHSQYWTTYVEFLCRAGQHSAARDAVAAARNYGVDAGTLTLLRARAGGERSAGEVTAAAATGARLLAEGRLEAARDVLKAATEGNPCDAETARRFAICLVELGPPTDPVPAIHAALQLRDDPELLGLLASTHHSRGNLREALEAYQAVVAARPDYVEAFNNLGIVQAAIGDAAAAQTSFRKVVTLRPELAEPWNNLGLVLGKLGQLTAARECFQRALVLDPDYAHACNSLGNLYCSLEHFDDAIACFRRALEIDPGYVTAKSSLLLTLSYTNISKTQHFEEALSYGEWVRRPEDEVYAAWQCPQNSTTLRVGLVSGDLSSHPVGYFLETVLPALAREGLSLHAFPTSTHVDALTAVLQASCATWTPVHALSDAQAAQAIHATGVHVLLDLSGHTAHGRLPIFAYRPAPLQISWLGYFATTGLAEMDYFVGDPWCLPETFERWFTEKPLRLPETRLCFTTPAVQVDVTAPPSTANGYVTYGCFNNLSKLNHNVLEAWRQILVSDNNSRLLLKALQLDDETVCNDLRERLAQLGVDLARVELEGRSTREDYLACYNRVDIALDPFPFSGATTTVEALWMGVPVVTLAGDTLVSRQGVSILKNLDLDDWIARDTADYVTRALRHAQNLPALADLRLSLRARMEASPVCDAPRFARHFANGLRRVWMESKVHAPVSRLDN